MHNPDWNSFKEKIHSLDNTPIPNQSIDFESTWNKIEKRKKKKQKSLLYIASIAASFLIFFLVKSYYTVESIQNRTPLLMVYKNNFFLPDFPAIHIKPSTPVISIEKEQVSRKKIVKEETTKASKRLTQPTKEPIIITRLEQRKTIKIHIASPSKIKEKKKARIWVITDVPKKKGRFKIGTQFSSPSGLLSLIGENTKSRNYKIAEL